MPAAIRVGIVGANAETGWARESHVPAVRGLAGYELAAVASSSREGAEKAAAAFGAPAAYGSGLDLASAPGIDLVAVTTRVPDHRELVLAALAAGKHVYCEWPLGRGNAEAVEMADAARAAGVRTAIGLQLRGSPVVRRARELLRAGAIGRLLSVRVSSATAGFGPVVPDAYAYLEDPQNFANLVTIQGAHTIDLAIAVAGRFADLAALGTAQYPEIAVGDGGERRARTTYDHVLLTCRLAGGAPLSIEVAGGRPPETPFRFEAVGERATLRLGGGAARGFQSGRLALSLDGVPQTVDEGETAALPDAAANVAGTYAALRDDLAHGTRTVPDFDHAARLTRLVSDVFASADDGGRRPHAGWPDD